MDLHSTCWKTYWAGIVKPALGGMIRLIFMKIYIYRLLWYYYLFGLMVTIVHKFMTYLAYLWNMLGYFVTKDKIFNIDGGMNWADHVLHFRFTDFRFISDSDQIHISLGLISAAQSDQAKSSETLGWEGRGRGQEVRVDNLCIFAHAYLYKLWRRLN